MNRHKISVLIILIVLTACYKNACADSLLSDSGGGICDIYNAQAAHRKGDVITILFKEKTISNQSGKGKLKNTYSTGAEQGAGFLEKFLGLGLSGGDTTDIEQTNSQTNTLTTTMSATVKEVLPNNQLLIEGCKILEVNHETENVTVTGIIRTVDIGIGNTVESTKIANLKAYVNGLTLDRSTKKRHGGIIRWVWGLIF